MIYKKSWKYILIKIHNHYTFYQLKAVKDFSDVKRGDLGGFVDGYRNLSQSGDCWIYDYAIVRDKARVSKNAKVSDYAIISANAFITGNARISGNAKISENAQVYDNAKVTDSAKVSGDVRIYGNTIRIV